MAYVLKSLNNFFEFIKNNPTDVKSKLILEQEQITEVTETIKKLNSVVFGVLRGLIPSGHFAFKISTLVFKIIYKKISNKTYNISDATINELIELCMEKDSSGEFIYHFFKLNKNEVYTLIYLLNVIFNIIPYDVLERIRFFMSNMLGEEDLIYLINENNVDILNTTKTGEIILKLNRVLFILREAVSIALDNMYIPDALNKCDLETRRTISKLENTCGTVYLTKILVIVKEFLNYFIGSKEKIITTFSSLLYVVNKFEEKRPTWTEVKDILDTVIIEKIEDDIFHDVPDAKLGGKRKKNAKSKKNLKNSKKVKTKKNLKFKKRKP